MDENEVRNTCIQVIQTAQVVYLTTIDKEGFPQTRALFNLNNKEQFPNLSFLFKDEEDDFICYFSTNTSSSKMEHIKSNPKVSAYYCLPNEFQGIMLGGLIEIITDGALKKKFWQDGWERYYNEGDEDPDYTILRLSPTFARGWLTPKTFEINLG
jgi:general stress protein 26